LRIALIAFYNDLLGSYALIQFNLNVNSNPFITTYQTKATNKKRSYYKHILPQKSIDDVREDGKNGPRQKKEKLKTLKKQRSL